jgi:hypothetical protein
MSHTAPPPEAFDPRWMAAAGIRVLDHGLPELPAVLTRQMAVPMAFWTTGNCAVVLFLRYPDRTGDWDEPVGTTATFSRRRDGWAADRWWTGSGWPDPIAEPDMSSHLGDRAIVTSGGSFTDRPSPGQPAAVAVGLVSPAVAAIALTQEGNEDRRELRSHFGAWVVCTEKWAPYRIDAQDRAGAVIGSIAGPPKLPPRPAGHLLGPDQPR